MEQRHNRSKIISEQKASEEHHEVGPQWKIVKFDLSLHFSQNKNKGMNLADFSLLYICIYRKL